MPKTPRETDTELAAIWRDIYAQRTQVGYSRSALLSLAGAKYHYRGRQRVTDMRLSDALEIVRELAAYEAAYAAEHTYDPNGGYPLINWDAWNPPHALAPYEHEKPAEELRKLEEREAKLAELDLAAEELERTYTGWSRFFLVTSSPGHVHSSMYCSTCRPTTTYGWLPELSGKDEPEAVAELGPTLCSVCFPSAPTEWTTGKKITAAQAAKRAA